MQGSFPRNYSPFSHGSLQEPGAPALQGDLILLPPNCFHSLRADNASPSNVFVISFTEMTNTLAPLGERVLHRTIQIKNLIHSIIREGDAAFVLPMTRIDRHRMQSRPDAPSGGEQIVRLRLEKLLILLCREAFSPQCGHGTRARYDNDIAGRIMAFLRENLSGQLTLADITAALGYGKTHLSKVFKRVYGQSMMDCYTQLKLEEAKYLLREGTMTAPQISAHLGFSSPQYFS